MKKFTTIGIDIAKNVIQIHAANSEGKAVFKKRLPREKFLNFMANLPPCLVGMEACGGAHYWARELVKLGFKVKLMSPRKVKKYLDNNKNDAKDAAACAEAVRRGSMQFVPIKTEAQLELQALHRVRSYFVKYRTGLTNLMRGLLLEMGRAIPKGKACLVKEVSTLLREEASPLSKKTMVLFQHLYEALKGVNEEIKRHTTSLEQLALEEAYCKQISTLPGIGPITATAVVAKIGNGSEFRKGRDLSAYLGLVPKQHSSGEKQRLLGISKHGDRYLRQLLIHGGRATLKAAMKKNAVTGLFEKQDVHSQWVRTLAQRVGKNKTSVAVANKNARMIVALLKHQTTFQPKLAH